MAITSKAAMSPDAVRALGVVSQKVVLMQKRMDSLHALLSKLQVERQPLLEEERKLRAEIVAMSPALAEAKNSLSLVHNADSIKSNMVRKVALHAIIEEG